MNDGAALGPGLERRRLALTLLFFASLFNYLDRQLLSILIEPVKAEFSLSDTDIAVLTGPAFAFFYVALGIPLARLADRGHRLSLLSISVAVWSLMTALCGVATTYWQLFMARVGVGIGEAGGTPPAHSLIMDYFKESERGRALSVYSFGVPAGIFCGFLLGGGIAETLGWRTAFLVLGLPGMLLAALIAIFLREPVRRSVQPDQPSLLLSLSDLFAVQSFRYCLLAGGFVAIGGYGAVQWTAPFLIRTHGVSLTEAGAILAVLVAVFSSLGVFIGGYLGDLLSQRKGLAWYAWVPAIFSLAACPIALGAFLSSSLIVALIFLALLNLLMNAITAPLFAGAYSFIPQHLRATASAVLLFSINLLGLGLGPLLVGLGSDLLAEAFGQSGLAYSLAILVFSYWVAAAAFLHAGRHLRRESASA
ncbi:MAG: MFS transporter [Pseudomonadales bacterium]